MTLQAAVPADFWTWLFSNQAWNDFPTVFLIAAFLTGIFLAGRWFWRDYKKEADRDRTWRQEQNKERERAQDSRDGKMMSFFTAINAGNVADIADMRETSKDIISHLDALVGSLANHDIQAKEIMRIVSDIKTELAKLRPRIE